MIENNMIDATDERDVTDLIEEGGTAGTPGMVIPEPSPMFPGNDIHFQSMDAKVYLISRDELDWAGMIAAKNTLEQNKTMVRQLMREILFAGNTSSNEAIQEAHDSVKQFLIDFGFDPTEGYKKIYPDAGTYEFALMYCIDANELLTVVLNEIEKYEIIRAMQNAVPTEEEVQ